MRCRPATAVLVARLLAGLVGVCAGVACAGGNTQFRDPADPSHVISKLWDDRRLPVTWVMSEDGLPGSGISNDALRAEVQAAFDAWQNVATSRIAFTFGGFVPARNSGVGGPLGPGIDGRNLVTFTDPDFIFPTGGELAVAITFSFATDVNIDSPARADLDGDGVPDIPQGIYPAGSIFDADIVFNSGMTFSIDGSNGSHDIRAIATHEVGHAIGLSHSMIRDAVMWPFLANDITAARTLKPDDIAYASFFYPAEPAFDAAFGAIRGQVTNGFNGAPILGAHVFAVDPPSGAMVVGAYSNDDGTYVIPGLAPQNWLVGIEPLDGDPVGLDPFRVNEVVAGTFDTNFPEEFYDANESSVEADPMAALPIAVTAGADTTGIDIVTNTVEVPGVNRLLGAGFNLLAYPVAVPTGTQAFDLLRALGDPSEVNALERFVPGTSTFERAEYVDGVPAGANFPIRRGEGYVVHLPAEKVVGFSGHTDCPDLDLVRGMNLIAVPCPAAGYTARQMLQDLGTQFEVESVQRFDPATAAYQRALWDATGAPSGDDFPIVNGEGYVVTMLLDKAGVRLPAASRSFAPVIDGLSPGRGVPGTVVVILGANFSAAPTDNLVTFNGAAAGVVFATSTSLTVTVPNGATTGPVRVVVGGRPSNTVDFVVEPATVDEDPTGPLSLVSGQTVNGTLSADGEQDRYEFTALAGSVVTASAESVTPGVPDLVLVLEDPFGVAVATDDNGGGGANPRINNFVVQNTGTHTIVVTNVPGSGTGAYRLHLTIATRSSSPAVSILGGDFQTALAGTTLPDPLTVLVTGPTGAPVSGVPVTFVATAATVGGLTAGPANAGTVVLATNASGVASVETTLGAMPGAYDITVTVEGAQTTFHLAASEVAIRTVEMHGDQQTGTVGTPLMAPLVIVVKDALGNGVSNAQVGFRVVSGGGSVDNPDPVLPLVGGTASTTFTLGQKVSDAQIVAAFIPGSSKPLLFTATPKADIPARLESDRSSFSRMTVGTSVLNALQVKVFDQYDNPVPGATVTYSQPGGLVVEPGLGSGGIVFSDFNTNADGLHVAMVTAPLTVTPTLDEFWATGDMHLAPTYSLTATVAGLGAGQSYDVDVDPGPTLVTASMQNASALIGQMLAGPVLKQIVRYQRIDGPDADHDFRNESFSRLAFQNTPGVPVHFAVQREDGESESAAVPPLTPTTTDLDTAVTDASSIATVHVTMGDVGGVNEVTGTIDVIPVDFDVGDGNVVHQDFMSGTKFAESTNVIANPVVLTVTIDDGPRGSGIDLTTVQASLNGLPAFFNGMAPPATRTFPERLDIIAGGVPLKSFDATVAANAAFPRVQLVYQPARPKLVGSNTVQVEIVKDRAGNAQTAVTTQGFQYP
jgi:hypothetical protein